ncbi:uncharacterized protein FIBRA_03901 [Fibroporia radiculosa]|uniref:Uncharacterized protein n=1 Tax=Fibroporia radiculosa TaxID=599839 RepID=J4G6I6_9APHY|nr:uncharacterized protein FIBRA_03901 [Fibroporia radiculosa]CCM01833.1 predicted protein [Fibroporia radiculosa]
MSHQQNSLQHAAVPVDPSPQNLRSPLSGPRKHSDKPTRHNTFHTMSASSPNVKSSTIRSHTFDFPSIHNRTNPPQLSPVAGPSPLRQFSASQPTNSPLSAVFVQDSGSLDLGHDFSPGPLLHSGPFTASPTHMARAPHRTAPESRKSSGNSTDRDAGAHLDLKRLLSKPLIHHPSASSAISLPSDSEVSVSSRSHPTYSSQPSSSSRGESHDRPMLHVASPSLNVSSKNTFSSSPSHRTAQDTQTRQRNVLRRPGRPATADDAGAGSGHVRRMRSVDALQVNASQPPPSPSSLSVATGRKGDLATRTSLTPAGQVALAYKQQELRREELAELSGWTERPRQGTPVPSSGRRGADVDSMPSPAEDEEETTGPYYTVFGSSSGHVVAAGSAQDYTQLDNYFMNEEQPRKPRRSLSRKMSGRFRKVSDAVKKEKDISPVTKDDNWRPYDGRLSSIPTPRMSLDERLEVSTQTSNSASTARGSTHERERSVGVMDERSPRLGKAGKSKTADRDEEAQVGGKLWRLVKRISTGGLRDKYKHNRESAPPVPPLPVDLQKLAGSRTTFEMHEMGGREGFGSNNVSPTQSHPSVSGARLPTGSSQKISPRHTTTSRPSTGKASSSPPTHRPSTTTRSSSPLSSDMASSGFFHRTQSTRSSSSSYGEEIPPVPSPHKAAVAQHIMPPSELYRLESNRTKEDITTTAPRKPHKPMRSMSEPTDHRRSPSSADESLPSLPCPPRRPGLSPREAGAHDRPASPPLPSFTTAGAVNNFSAPSLPLPEFGAIPTRPRRSSRRKPASIELPAPSVSSSLATRSPLTPRTPRAQTKAPSDAPARASMSTLSYNAATPLSPSSTSTSPSSASSSQHRSPLTFRELESPRQAWSEQEKVDKWEALLERSARAGGTLHISETGLLSESMSLSDLPES